MFSNNRTLPALILALGCFAASSLSAGLPPEAVHFMPDVGSAEAGAPVQATAILRTKFLPLPRVKRVERQLSEIRVFISKTTGIEETTNYFDHTLSADLPALEPGTYQVRFFVDQEPLGEPLAEGSFVVKNEVAKLALEAPNPTPENDVLLRITPRPCDNATLTTRKDDRIRVYVDGCFIEGDTTGATISLGRLPAGSYKADLLFVESYFTQDIAHEVAFTVAERPFSPETPVVLAGSFEVDVTWRNAAGESGVGRLVQAPSQDSALFYFFSPDNWELMVKVLDGCAINGHYWVFGAASTDVAYDIEITRRGSTQTFAVNNPLGNAAEAITEIQAFPCDPAAPQG